MGDDDINFKKENSRKFKNNQRYKSHHKPAPNKTVTKKPSATRKPSEEDLPNNWSKYEIQPNDESFSEASNFEKLLDNPVSQASYFKFKHEENWSKSVEFHSQFQKYFILDMNLLNAGVNCVKFTERHGYNDEMLKSLDDTSEKAQLKYEEYLKKVSSKKTTVVLEETGNKTSQQKTENTCNKLSGDNRNSNFDEQVHTATDDDDINDLLENKCNLTEINDCLAEDPLMSRCLETQIVNKITNTTDDLEQWLDDILED